MLKEYLAGKSKSIYSLAKECGVPYSTLSDFVNGKVRASECRAGMIRSIARVLGITMDELYDISEKASEEVNPSGIMTSYGIPVSVRIRHKSFQAELTFDGEPVVLELCRVSGSSRYCIGEIAKCRAEEYIRRRKMTDFGKGK